MNTSIPRLAGRARAALAVSALVLLSACLKDGTGTGSGNPQPALSALSVAEVTRGAPAEAITVTGSGFVAGSVVRFDGVERPTEYVGPTRLRVVPAPDDFAESGAIEVTVHNPPPGGGTSAALRIDVTSPVIALGDTVAEELTGAPGGLREFRIAGRAGDEWIAFVQADQRVDLVVADSAASEPVARAAAHWPTTELEEISTRRFLLPRT